MRVTLIRLENGVYLGVKTCESFLCLGVIVCVLYIVSGIFVVLLVLCFTTLVSFTGFYTEDESENGALRKRSSNWGNLITPASRFSVSEKQLENKAF